MENILSLLFLCSITALTSALHYDKNYVGYNLNENPTAVDPLDYTGLWKDHTFQPSPQNWRFPFYTVFLDRFVNGDPSNDNINGTVFEHDPLQTQLRHGGDLQGLVDSLDYIQGMGIKAIYVAGTIFINEPWGSDGYSPLDLTLLDQHFGDIQMWRTAINAIHDRGMYIIVDNTMSTMGDLIVSDGYANSSAPFTLKEHQVEWRDPDRRYFDFEFGNNYNQTCHYPRFWLDTGFPVGENVTEQMVGCYNSEFDQYGDIASSAVVFDWQRQLSKWAGVQDRLREWVPSVRAKIERFSCLAIMMLDIDGFRLDKATQITVDALGDFSSAMRECASMVGKDNFIITGEIAGGNNFGSVYLGRGRQPNMKVNTFEDAFTLNNNSNSSLFIRDPGQNALDGAAFHYSIYRSLTRFLGLDGMIEGGQDTPGNFVQAWNEMILTNDLVNANTNTFDPRHMLGTSNQDTFRWPALKDGTERMLLGQFITTLLFPGIPLLLWGEEQAFYTLDNTASDYLFGRQAMSSSLAWELHSCYKLGSTEYNNFPLDSALHGCEDPSNRLDHRDVTNPVRNIIKSMYQMRQNYPVLNDGWYLKQLSNQTHDIYLPASGGHPTETGMWSVMRSGFNTIQDFSGYPTSQGNQPVWLVYQNDNKTVKYQFDCTDNDTALIAPFDAGTTVKNLFYPHDELVLIPGPVKLGLSNSSEFNGCLADLTLAPYEYRAYVPLSSFAPTGPMVTTFLPGHDARLNSSVGLGQQETVPIEFQFSAPMDCATIGSSLSFGIKSTTEDQTLAKLDEASISCGPITNPKPMPLVGGIPSVWSFKANLTGVSNGIHELTLSYIPTLDNTSTTGATDRFLFRIGQSDNPVVFPQEASYAADVLHRLNDGTLLVSHKAAGADAFRYSTNWGSTYSEWQPYPGGNSIVTTQPWSGTASQKWEGEHIILQYHSQLAGSSDFIQHGDLRGKDSPARRFPHLFANGAFNRYGLDMGLANAFSQTSTGQWTYNLMAEWPTNVQVNVWGINPDGQPDRGFVFGDVDGDNVLDRLPPNSLSSSFVNITGSPPAPYLAWQVSIDDETLRYTLVPTGSRAVQMVIYLVMWIIPITTAGVAVWLYMLSFYQVKFNQIGVTKARGLIPSAILRKLGRRSDDVEDTVSLLRRGDSTENVAAGVFPLVNKNRRTTLIATMEYDIEDWAIKVKIGGLGVMAQLMGKNLESQNLIWVVPCVGDIDYPDDPDEPSVDPMKVTILGKPYMVNVRIHQLKNITYVLLDAPVFRAQSKSEPYPPRMDDLDSAIYYSAWNQCIALTIKRYPTIDLYHINDYHGALAPLHLLPQTIPVALSLHNAEFQGLWPMRTPKEREEVCNVYNLNPVIVQRYVQFGSVFNLLHAGASYIRIHQRGFGAVGVSKKYGKRSWARYPIFWGLDEIGQLPNPDPSDTAALSDGQDAPIVIDEQFESGRAELKRQAQEWANLDQRPDAELLVFVGRWSMQKGVDLIADVMPALLEENDKVQLICVGPVIDLYGKFAALKLSAIMKKYPGRVYSKPEFTALPPYIFSGAEFALIPSRDEPFGLVAVEFGRKGALGIGARVGGLGQMPGWWFTVESTSTLHMLHQFKTALKEALASDRDTRRMMRARSAKQRFPVAQWIADLDKLQSKAIKIHQKEAPRRHGGRLASPRGRNLLRRSVVPETDSLMSGFDRSSSAHSQDSQSTTPRGRDSSIRSTTPDPVRAPITSPGTPGRTLSLGRRAGPGHAPALGPSINIVASTPMSPHQRSDTWETLDTVAEGDEPEEGSDEWFLTAAEVDDMRRGIDRDRMSSDRSPQRGLLARALTGRRTSSPNFLSPRSRPESPYSSPESTPPGSPPVEARHLSASPLFSAQNDSTLSLDLVVGTSKHFSLQNVDANFTDSDEMYYKTFEQSLHQLDKGNSEKSLCIEEFLKKSEKEWFGKYRAAKNASSRESSAAPLLRRPMPSDGPEKGNFQSLLGDNYQRPSLIKRVAQWRIGDWPLYSLFLALGQILAATSYQITLLSGTIKQDDVRFYTITAIYLVTSIIWWYLFRRLKAVYVLSTPFVFYGLAFLMLGLAPLVHSTGGKGWMLNVASGMYATASSSGSLFFAMNFGDEGGSPVKAWIYRCCVIQGTQQIYVLALWFWGDYITKLTSRGNAINTSTTDMTIVMCPIAGLLFIIGLFIFTGLPDYYRQDPGQVPSFYSSLFRRHIVVWFWVAVILQNLILSSQYGRNWEYLWSSNHAKVWQIAVLTLGFFILVWAAILFLFSRLSKTHTWILPIFAIGLGAPRWAQTLWSCSNIGFYLPWVGSALASTLLGRSLWLWLGVLDALQGVGFGMILLQTLTRIHISAALIGSQVLGSVATMLAHAAQSGDGNGPGILFPSFAAGALPGLASPWFWVGLISQLFVCVGFFAFFRKEQLSKP